MSPHIGVVMASGAADRALTSVEKQALLNSLSDSLRDVLEVVPSGQPATCVRHDDSLFAAPGVTLQKSQGEKTSESGGR